MKGVREAGGSIKDWSETELQWAAQNLRLAKAHCIHPIWVNHYGYVLYKVFCKIKLKTILILNPSFQKYIFLVSLLQGLFSILVMLSSKHKSHKAGNGQCKSMICILWIHYQFRLYNLWNIDSGKYSTHVWFCSSIYILYWISRRDFPIHIQTGGQTTAFCKDQRLSGTKNRFAS